MAQATSAGSARGRKLVVLTFDDAVKSHRTIVAPLLKDLGFGATFFITHRWMTDPDNFLTWEEVAEIHHMGFEIGNHTWMHEGVAVPKNVARLTGDLALIEHMLARIKVPPPVSFAYPGNAIGPEAVEVLRERGLKFGRRGIAPEVAYEGGLNQIGPAFDPRRHHPLVIPSTGIADPCWNMEQFKRVVAESRDGRIAVLQFHGVPDPIHPWVHTPPDGFREYMHVLKAEGFSGIALRDLEPYIDWSHPPADPVLKARYPAMKRLALPVEVEATQGDLDFWMENMMVHHRYTPAEASHVSGVPEARIEIPRACTHRPSDAVLALPYPGGRHPRIGFLEGAVDPQRGSKASIFLPWDPASYVVVDLPEAVFSNIGLIFLAHTHIPTIWNDQNLVLDNVDWSRGPGGTLSFRRHLPNGITFGASLQPRANAVDMELWLRNVTHLDLTGLRTQVCVMLKGAAGFNAQTDTNKKFRKPVAGVRSAVGNRWILTEWEDCGRVWGNPQVPCIHADPVFPDCASGQTVQARGRLWFDERFPA